MGSVIVITSGKGGTGKTSLTGGIGAALARQGRRTLCLDGDVGLRNLDLALGMADAALMDFTDVMAGCPLDRAVAPHPAIDGLYLLTAPLTLPADFAGEAGFRAMLDRARADFDFVLVDAPAGLGDGFRLAVSGADRAIVVATADPASLRDAQRVVDALEGLSPVHLVVNRVRGRLLRRLGATIDDAMDAVGLPLLGLVPEDVRVVLAAGSGQAVCQVTEKGAAQAYENLARRVQGEQTPLMRIW